MQRACARARGLVRSGNSKLVAWQGAAAPRGGLSTLACTLCVVASRVCLACKGAKLNLGLAAPTAREQAAALVYAAATAALSLTRARTSTPPLVMCDCLTCVLRAQADRPLPHDYLMKLMSTVGKAARR